MALGTLDFRMPYPGSLAFGSATNSLAVAGILPALTGNAAVAWRSELAISGTLPALTGNALIAPQRSLTVAGILPALTGVVTFDGVRILQCAGILPALTGRSYLAIPVYPPRGPAYRVIPTWHTATLISGIPRRSPWRVATPAPLAQRSPWHTSERLAHRIHLPEISPVQQPLAQRSWWNNGALRAARLASITDLPVQQPTRQRSWWNNATPLAARGDWDDLFPLITPVAIDSPWHTATPASQSWISGWQPALPQPQSWRSWWDSAMPPPPGLRFRPPPVTPPIRPRGRLDFRCPARMSLDFGNACFGSAGWLVPIRESYSVLNSGSLIRISDGADIPVSSLTVKIDRDSWCWSLSASLIGRTAADLATERTEVLATINGFQWKFVIDTLSRDREFGKTDGSISGRSLLAWWSAPYTPTGSYLETDAKTAEQLALQAIPYGGFLDWQLPTWTVPARVWQYQNLTPVEVLARLAKSAGGMVQADPVDLKFWLSPRWPVKPWEWSTTSPFATLPSAYCTREEREGIPGTEHDAIMVYGGMDSGIVCMATRAGQPGLVVAPPVNDTLIVDIEPAKARAVQEIADLWPMRQFTITLPLQAQPDGAGLIQPGLFFDFSDGDDGWRGLATAVSISASFGKTTQTVTTVSA